jgi:hypothetical protein
MVDAEDEIDAKSVAEEVFDYSMEDYGWDISVKESKDE